MLALPWGFEIYALLTRWNPLDFRRPLPRPDSGRKVLVVGLGPAGFTLAHHLMNDGHTVVGDRRAEDRAAAGDDPASIAGARSRSADPTSLIYENLDDRVMAGFGGVAEYGITVRWDKNFLKMIRLLLERRAAVRDVRRRALRRHADASMDDAFAMGFDHIALCMGAGRPTVHRHAERPGARRARRRPTS